MALPSITNNFKNYVFKTGSNGTPFSRVVHLKVQTYRERIKESVTAVGDSATTRSTAAGTPGLPELEREPRRHINEEHTAGRTSEPTHDQSVGRVPKGW